MAKKKSSGLLDAIAVVVLAVGGFAGLFTAAIWLGHMAGEIDGNARPILKGWVWFGAALAGTLCFPMFILGIPAALDQLSAAIPVDEEQ